MGGLLVAAVGGQPVVHRTAGEPGQHPGRVHRRPAPPGVQVVKRDPVGAHHVHPPQRGGDSTPGLVEVHHRRAGQLRVGHRFELRQPVGGSRQQPGQVAGRDRRAEAVGQAFSRPLHRQVLTAQQVGAERRSTPGP